MGCSGPAAVLRNRFKSQTQCMCVWEYETTKGAKRLMTATSAKNAKVNTHKNVKQVPANVKQNKTSSSGHAAREMCEILEIGEEAVGVVEVK